MRAAMVFAVFALVSAGAAGADEPGSVSRQPSWEGRSADELVGTNALRWRDAGIGPSSVGIEDRPDAAAHPVSEIGSLRLGGDQEVIATQKVKFYVDERGIIDKAEVSPLKWKSKP